MRYKVLTFIAAFFLTLSLVLRIAYAQNSNLGTAAGQGANGTAVTNPAKVFDLRWLIVLIAIPIVVAVLASHDEHKHHDDEVDVHHYTTPTSHDVRNDS